MSADKYSRDGYDKVRFMMWYRYVFRAFNWHPAAGCPRLVITKRSSGGVPTDAVIHNFLGVVGRYVNSSPVAVPEPYEPFEEPQ